MILYIDDIHLMFGDQGSGGDALRSVLNDGQVRILGTCGWREWRRYIEPDPGLARRIAAVRIQEPNDKEAWRLFRASPRPWPTIIMLNSAKMSLSLAFLLPDATSLPTTTR